MLTPTALRLRSTLALLALASLCYTPAMAINEHTVRVNPASQAVEPFWVSPYDDLRLIIEPKEITRYEIAWSEIVKQSTGDTVLWHKTSHAPNADIYDVANAFSGTEFMSVIGSLTTRGGGGGGGQMPIFQVTVPEVDIDWDKPGYRENSDEAGEDFRILWIGPNTIYPFLVRRPIEETDDMMVKIGSLSKRPLPDLEFYVFSNSGLLIYATEADALAGVNAITSSRLIPRETWNNTSGPLRFYAKQNLAQQTLPQTMQEIRLTRGGLWGEKPTPFEGDYSGGTYDCIKFRLLRPDIDVDTNNDGTINPLIDGEDQYEQYEPGLLLDRWDALAEASGQLKEIKLSGFPQGAGLNAKLTKTGLAGLNIHLANNLTSAKLPTSTVWTDAKPPPQSLWVQGRSNGKALLKFSVYDPAKPTEIIASDEVCLTVLPPASYSPGGGSFAAIWAPLRTNDNLNVGNNVGWGDAWIINDVLKSQGWTQVKWYEDVTGDTDLNLGTCTIENYLDMRNAGVMCVTASHGGAGSHSAVYATHTTKGREIIQNWCSNQLGMACFETQASTNGPGYYYAYVSSDWMSENWKTQLDANRAITVFSICYSATASIYRKSVKEAAGGRWRIGYLGTTWASEAEIVNNEFFRNMNGKLNNGSRRTAGAAYNSGQGYTPNVKMDGNSWTTLCPTLCENVFATYPSPTVDNRKGWGCLIFDTYMDSTISASQIIAVTPNITKLGWVEVGAGKRAVGFNFQKTVAPWFMDVECHTENGRSEGAGGGRSVDWDGIAPNGEFSPGWFF